MNYADRGEIAASTMTTLGAYPRDSAIAARQANRTQHLYTDAARRAPRLAVRLLPIVFFLTYLTATVLMFAFGPWPYHVEHVTKLYTFVAAAHLALLAGYLSAFRRVGRGYAGRWRLKRLVIVSLGISLALLYPSAAFRVGVASADLVAGTASLGDGYAASIATRAVGTPIIEYIRFFVGPWLALLLPLVVFYWALLSWKIRVFAVLFVFGHMWMYVLMGTNAGIAYIVLLCPWLIAARHFAGMGKLPWNRRIAAGAAAATLLILFLLFFTETQSTRAGTSIETRYFPGGRVWADDDNFMVRNLHGSVKRGALALVCNLTHGYYGLYLALDKPFVPTFGVGSSFFLTRQAVRLTGLKELAQAPYPMRIEIDGWDAYGLWSTIYPWIASDVSFPGTLLVVFLIGRFFALSWLDTLRGENPFAVAMFAQFVIMLFYFNVNNQCLMGGEGISGFAILLILWLRTRRRVANGARRWIVWS